MSAICLPVRVAFCGSEHGDSPVGRGCGLWPIGYAAAITAADAVPVPLDLHRASHRWAQHLQDIQGVVLAGSARTTAGGLAAEEELCLWCRDHAIPILAVDHGMQVLNTAFGGSVYLDLSRELPEALQHRHPPEPGLRHAITVEAGTRLAGLYGEGEFVVNSEHRRAVQRLARGFVVSARALDGVIEAIEAEGERWFALGVQWHPASSTASGLDIQLFRGLVDMCKHRRTKPTRRRPAAAQTRRRVLAGVA
jgi:gamma-glutamyl-gamma-aminobutyrate hydrolase PuuD